MYEKFTMVRALKFCIIYRYFKYNNLCFICPYFHIGINDNFNWCYHNSAEALELNQWYPIEISQVQEDSKYYFIVQLNGTEVRRVENKKPRVFSGVDVFASDPLHTPAKALIRKLQYHNLPEGN